MVKDPSAVQETRVQIYFYQIQGKNLGPCTGSAVLATGPPRKSLTLLLSYSFWSILSLYMSSSISPRVPGFHHSVIPECKIKATYFFGAFILIQRNAKPHPQDVFWSQRNATVVAQLHSSWCLMRRWSPDSFLTKMPCEQCRQLLWMKGFPCLGFSFSPCVHTPLSILPVKPVRALRVFAGHFLI